MTWAVFLALLGIAVVVAAAWLLGRPRSPERLARGSVRLEDADAPVGRARHVAAGPGFGAQTRGYRMDQVDTVVDSLEARLAEHDREIALLRGEAPEAPEPPDRLAAPPSTAAAPVERAPGEDEPPPRPGPAAGRDEPPAVGRPVPLRRSDLWAPLAYLLLAGWVLAGLIAQPAHRLPVPGGAGPAGVRVVLRRRGAQPDLAVEPALLATCRTSPRA